jgi:hypothetical protein
MIIVNTSANFTRPEDTTQYTSGDLVANSTTAGSVVPMTFVVPNRGIKLWRVSLLRSATTVTDAQFRLHLYNNSPTCANGDNGAWSTTASGYQGYVDIDGQNQAFSDDGLAFGVYVNNSVFAPMYIYADSDRLIYGLIEARDTYTPASAEVFTATLIGESYQ